jgi:hypothetical protein
VRASRAGIASSTVNSQRFAAILEHVSIISIEAQMLTLLSVSVIFNCCTTGRISRYFDTSPITDTIAESLLN